MKIVVKKDGGLQATARAVPARRAPQVQATARPGTSEGGKTVAIWIAAVVIAVVALGDLYWKTNQKPRVVAAQRAPPPAARPVVRGGALDGVDLKAWCREHEKDNQDLQNRRARRSGSTPPPAPQP
jgi:hypothetical protein